MLRFVSSIILTFSSYCGVADSQVYDEGAQLFVARCVLCHGLSGMGEGLLPLKLVDYPNTNLLHKNSLSRKLIYTTIQMGGTGVGLSNLMPPMKDELTEKELNTLADFVVFLRTDNAVASKKISKELRNNNLEARTGKQIYATRCTLCHGETGKGDGRMSKVIQNPPPSNFINSTVDVNYIENIVYHGGKAMGRSYQMPPWQDQLSKEEIQAVARYVLSLRKHKQ